MDIPQSFVEGPQLKVLPPGSHSSSILNASPARVPLPKAKGEVSMTMEVRVLLSQVGLNMSDLSLGNSSPKKLDPLVLVTPLPTKPEDFPQPVDTSSQVSTQMMLKWRMPLWRKSPLPPPLQLRPLGPEVM